LTNRRGDKTTGGDVMDKIEAEKLLTQFLVELKRRSFEDLKSHIRDPVCVSVEGITGTQYQIEYESVWDLEPGGDLRIFASIDDGGFFSALRPLTSGFVITPHGEILD
jgi:hypothetical protein